MTSRVISRTAPRLKQAGAAIVNTVALVLGYGVCGLLLMLAIAALLATSLPDGGVLAAAGRAMLFTSFAVAGAVCGGLLGVNVAAARGVDAFEREIQHVFAQFTPADAERIVPSMPLAQVRGSYEQALDAMVEQTLGRVRLPMRLRRLVRAGLRRAMVEDFLARCEAEGKTTIGFSEMRDWLVAQGVPLATAPVRAKIRVWRSVILAVPILLVAVALALSLPAAGFR